MAEIEISTIFIWVGQQSFTQGISNMSPTKLTLDLGEGEREIGTGLSRLSSMIKTMIADE